MKTIRTKEYTFTGYTLATREFILKSHRKELPPEAATADLKKVSKILGLDLTNIENAYLLFKDGSSIEFQYDPLGGDDSKTVQGQEFIRDWYTRKTEQYIHHKHDHITYSNGIISIYIVGLYESYGKTLYIEVPEKFPIDDWETFAKDPHREVFPHIPLRAVTKLKVTKNGALVLEVSAPKK